MNLLIKKCFREDYHGQLVGALPPPGLPTTWVSLAPEAWLCR